MMKGVSKWLTAPAVRRVGLLVGGLLLGLVTEQVASLDVLPPEAVAALRMLAAALSGS